MPSRPHRLSPLAEADLEGIWLYSVTHWSLEQADRYLHDLLAAFRSLASGAIQGKATDIRPGYRKYFCGAHVIYFLDPSPASGRDPRPASAAGYRTQPMNPPNYQQHTRDLIDGLKAVCAGNGLGNDGNEYKIIVQTFLYQMLCAQFAHAMKRIEIF